MISTKKGPHLQETLFCVYSIYAFLQQNALICFPLDIVLRESQVDVMLAKPKFGLNLP